MATPATDAGLGATRLDPRALPSQLDRLRQFIDGRRPPPPIARLIGFTPVDVAPGKAVFELVAGPQHANPMSALHGGVLCDLPDAAMGVAYATTLTVDETFATIELKINFLKPVWSARLRATGRLVKRGRTMGFVECDITDEQGALVARASSTCTTLSGEQARGR